MLHKVLLQGRLTADPELKHTQGGVSVTSFTIAVDRAYRSGEERQADFITIVAWRNTAEFICRYFGKGKMIVVDGKLQVRNWSTQDGSKRYATEVVADEVHFAGDKQETTQPTFAPPTQTATASFKDLEGDDGELPF